MAEVLTGRNEIRRLIADLGKIPPELRRRLRPAVREAARPVLAEAKSRASWSTRIPAALRMRVSFTQRRAGVSLAVDRDRAPHARPLEGITGNPLFRHPVFGDREKWVEQRTKPFLAPAVEARALVVVDAVNRAVLDTARKAGFHQ